MQGYCCKVLPCPCKEGAFVRAWYADDTSSSVSHPCPPCFHPPSSVDIHVQSGFRKSCWCSLLHAWDLSRVALGNAWCRELECSECVSEANESSAVFTTPHTGAPGMNVGELWGEVCFRLPGLVYFVLQQLFIQCIWAVHKQMWNLYMVPEISCYFWPACNNRQSLFTLFSSTGNLSECMSS